MSKTKIPSIATATDQRKRALAVSYILQEAYGAPFRFFSDKDPVSQMVSALLSHRTKNAVSRDAYHALVGRYPEWENVITAPTEEVQATIQMVTFPEVKAPRIQQALLYLQENCELSLDFLADMSVPEARAWLEKIPGIGAKTSAAILNFSRLHMPALVVDTHHLRVAQRIGIIPPKCSLDKGARLLASYLPDDWTGQQVYDDHQGFMRHGQRVCHWQQPNCSVCIVRDQCDYFQNKKA
ncbi:endonuclease III domain-containing protein [Flavilitoribacter nigricans]|uniref:Fe-S cluster assembly protein HesB n=1 Tax=Flavilitoribacter nigricans (strain ATCC 23147 / DSM 23189 / NBRC 102662 / NCIMB 1420 / SS-2) TaxID=1122177 RepID=A0A2D0NDF3_FLAN2|nr:Fe-S cluster assembly protein HesB [Flavilitoribacter nigricans]PHN06541.1 Fe-S cluster assembly protein HesB [Flavilitoribacter nigricans DSM 23189 = NBRC 102662]